MSRSVARSALSLQGGLLALFLLVLGVTQPGCGYMTELTCNWMCHFGSKGECEGCRSVERTVNAWEDAIFHPFAPEKRAPLPEGDLWVTIDTVSFAPQVSKPGGKVMIESEYTVSGPGEVEVQEQYNLVTGSRRIPINGSWAKLEPGHYTGRVQVTLPADSRITGTYHVVFRIDARIGSEKKHAECDPETPTCEGVKLEIR